ncbi:MAG: phosphoadenosine phosphosulfate reductase family protein, partial [Tuberibacillus sp.]
MTELLTYWNWDDTKAASLLDKMNDDMDVLKWAYREYGDKIVYSCSFGAESIVLLDLISKVEKRDKVIFLDTH